MDEISYCKKHFRPKPGADLHILQPVAGEKQIIHGTIFWIIQTYYSRLETTKRQNRFLPFNIFTAVSAQPKVLFRKNLHGCSQNSVLSLHHFQSPPYDFRFMQLSSLNHTCSTLSTTETLHKRPFPVLFSNHPKCSHISVTNDPNVSRVSDVRASNPPTKNNVFTQSTLRALRRHTCP